MAVPAETATVGKRIAAFALDYLLIAAYLLVLSAAGSWLTFGPLGGKWQALTSSPWRLDLVAFATAVLPVILYFTLLEGSAHGATWGKRRLRLRVARIGGSRLGRGRALVRSVFKFLPWQLAHTCLIHIPGWPIDPQEPPLWVVLGLILVWALIAVYVLTLLVRRDRRTPYDTIAGSQVMAIGQTTPSNG